MLFPSVLANTRTAEIILNLAAQSLFVFILGWIFSLISKRGSAPLRSGGLLILILILAFWPLKIAFFPAAQGELYRIPVESPASLSTESLAQDSAGIRNNIQPADRLFDKLLDVIGGCARLFASLLLRPKRSESVQFLGRRTQRNRGSVQSRQRPRNARRDPR